MILYYIIARPTTQGTRCACTASWWSAALIINIMFYCVILKTSFIIILCVI